MRGSGRIPKVLAMKALCVLIVMSPISYAGYLLLENMGLF
jgi:hypothetical protein